MHRIATFCLLGSAAALGGCMQDMGPGHAGMGSKAAPPATATLTDAGGVVVGTATFRQAGTGIHMMVDAKGLPPGLHGIHIHTVGRCEAPDFTTAGGHWNPTNMKHGKDAPGGPHMGDIPNLTIAADGTGKLAATFPGTLTGGATPLLDTDGAAVVIHAAVDDYKTDPSGASGGRIACGVINAG